jgi:ATP-dependent DNA helicase RecG
MKSNDASAGGPARPVRDPGVDEAVLSGDAPAGQVRGVGEVRAAQLARMGIHTVQDLLCLRPRRYEDRRAFRRIAELKSKDVAVVSATVAASGMVRPRFGKPHFEVAVRDASGLAYARWYGAAHRQDQLRVGVRLLLYGKVSLRKGTPVFVHPDLEILEEDDPDVSLHMGRIVPVYPLTEDLGQRTLRRIVHEAVERTSAGIEEFLPAATLDRCRLMGRREAIRQLHAPVSLDHARQARLRLAFEEFLCMQLVLAARKIQAERTLTGYAHRPAGRLRSEFLASLPFQLTAAQTRVLAEIGRDLAAPRPMHRLLQGDVGSGKTVVAAGALLDVIECGSQGAVMAPTEVLARQHAITFEQFFRPLSIRSACLTGEMSPAQRKQTGDRIAAGEVQLVIGTHALIQDNVRFHRLGLAVIDEQHKFGVEQRGLLYGKGVHPDVLVMTATPIPRTLAMTLYGDLDVSTLDERPAGRPEIITRVIRANQLPDAYEFIRKQVARGRQAFVVYPLVSESDRAELRSAEAMFQQLQEKEFVSARLGLLHGQMPAARKDEVMAQFRAGGLDVLVATSVVEVGIDVPNATVMLVENAERFGLAQLHQLRGRIGRGSHKSYCVIQGNPHSLESWRRLRILQETLDGFRIAEEDFKIRGMGNLLGPEQSGLPALRLGDPLADVEALEAARAEAFSIIEADPRLERPEHEPLRRRARSLYRAAAPFAQVG